MNYDVVSDSRLAVFLRRQINLRQINNPKLKPLRLCGYQIIKQLGAIPSVFLLSDGEDEDAKSRIFGVASCHSAWACPKCMPIVMAQKGTDIACAIDALAVKQILPMMITFTLPHHRYMSCEDSYTILQETWRHFTRDTKRHKVIKYKLKLDINEKNTRGGKAVGKKGEERIYLKGNNVWGGFREDFKITHSVRTYEFTWSEKNGWHPHIHALFWTHKSNFDKVIEREQELCDFWWYCAKFEALKYYNKKEPNKKEENKKLVEEFYTEWRKKSKDGHMSLYISKDKDNPNKARVVNSSFYIAGWSGDAELTASNYKSAAPGHLTPYQMLKMAYDDARLIDKFIPLYLEYCNATFKHRRVEFSKTGINKIIKAWKQTLQFKEIIKKKFTEKLGGDRKFKVVYWFSENQWKQIMYLEATTDEEIVPELLLLAKRKDCRAEIDKLLLSYGIPLCHIENPLIKHVEEKVFENRFKIAS